MPDAIRVSGMRFWGKHGALPDEREKAQPIDVDLELTVDLAKAAHSDHLGDTVDYAAIYKKVEATVAQRSFALLEALAEAIASDVLSDRRIARVTVRVRKPRLLEGATPEIELTRDNRLGRRAAEAEGTLL